jgi:hypothetical protein
MARQRAGCGAFSAGVGGGSTGDCSIAPPCSANKNVCFAAAAKRSFGSKVSQPRRGVRGGVGGGVAGGAQAASNFDNTARQSSHQEPRKTEGPAPLVHCMRTHACRMDAPFFPLDHGVQETKICNSACVAPARLGACFQAFSRQHARIFSDTPDTHLHFMFLLLAICCCFARALPSGGSVADAAPLGGHPDLSASLFTVLTCATTVVGGCWHLRG